jgi:hypothetical protein
MEQAEELYERIWDLDEARKGSLQPWSTTRGIDCRASSPPIQALKSDQIAGCTSDNINSNQVTHDENLKKLRSNLKLTQFLRGQAHDRWMSNRELLDTD